MASKKQLEEEAEAMVNSLNANIHEIELSIKSGVDEVDQQITTHLTALKKIRLELRLAINNHDLAQMDDQPEKVDDIWETISEGRKLLSEKKKVFKNRANKQ